MPGKLRARPPAAAGCLTGQGGELLFGSSGRPGFPPAAKVPGLGFPTCVLEAMSMTVSLVVWSRGRQAWDRLSAVAQEPVTPGAWPHTAPAVRAGGRPVLPRACQETQAGTDAIDIPGDTFSTTQILHLLTHTHSSFFEEHQTCTEGCPEPIRAKRSRTEYTSTLDCVRASGCASHGYQPPRLAARDGSHAHPRLM